MEGVEGICSLARPGKRSPVQTFSVDANSAYTAVFTIVPLKVGTFPIRVEAFVDFSGDIIVKDLLVEVSTAYAKL